MKLYVGTSGYSYKPWKGKFYPKELPEKEMLRYYSSQFGAVEINNTFYRMPRPSLLENWASEVPADFRFSIKAPQRITHFQRLKDADDSVAHFLKVSAVLGARLGPLLFQVPPNFKSDLKRLRTFLALLRPERRAAFEFRHESWFDTEVFALLHEHQASLCIADAEGGGEVPFLPTADWGYLRLRRLDYGDAELKAWVDRIRATRWQEAFIFFKHEDKALGPRMAKRFLELAGN